MMIWGTAMPCSYGFQPDAADAAPDAEQLGRVDAAALGDGVLAVAGEHEVVVAEGARGADLRGLLAGSGGQSPSSPCRWSAVASVSRRRTTTMSR